MVIIEGNEKQNMEINRRIENTLKICYAGKKIFFNKKNLKGGQNKNVESHTQINIDVWK